MAGCPFLEDNTSIVCVKECKGERLKGQWKICVGSRYDPLPSTTVEIIGTGMINEEGDELFEVYLSHQYCGSCYATSEEIARSKAMSGQLIELTNS
jgi:hypothetical protein